QVQMRRNLQAILSRSEGGEGAQDRFLADIGQQTKQMEAGRAAEVLCQLAERYYRSGRWELAAECYDLVVERYGQHPLTGAALVGLVEYYSRSEGGWRFRSAQQLTARQVNAQLPDRAPAAGRRAGGVSAGAEIEAADALVADVRSSDNRAQRA